MEYTKGECGCKVVSGFLCGNTIEYCPLHKSAPELYEALKDILPVIQAIRGADAMDRASTKVVTEVIKKVLSKAEGGK